MKNIFIIYIYIHTNMGSMTIIPIWRYKGRVNFSTYSHNIFLQHEFQSNILLQICGLLRTFSHEIFKFYVDVRLRSSGIWRHDFYYGRDERFVTSINLYPPTPLYGVTSQNFGISLFFARRISNPKYITCLLYASCIQDPILYSNVCPTAI